MDSLTDAPTLTQRYRTIWISDIHLGYKHCKAEFLLDFLKSTESDTLFLVGDVIDTLSLKRHFYWPGSHQQVIDLILDKQKHGTRIIYIPGNHDELDGLLVGSELLRIESQSEFIYTTADNRVFLVCHGDEFDSVVCGGRLNRWIGRIGYNLLLHVSDSYNWIRKCLGKPYWSLTTYVKNRVKRARNTIDKFESTAAAEAKRRSTNGISLDGIICGHIHQPEIRYLDSVLYCNDGDWVENCTAMAEDQNGSLNILHWADLKQPIKSEHPSIHTSEPLAR